MDARAPPARMLENVDAVGNGLGLIRLFRVTAASASFHGASS